MAFGNTLNSAIFVFMRLVLLASCFLLNMSLMQGQPLNCDPVSEAALLINSDTGHILFEKNMHDLRYPASITKVATALYILTKYEKRLDEKVVAKREALASITPQAKKQSNYRAPAYWLETDGTHIGIKVGEEFTVKTLMAALLIASANDAANVMAEHFEGNIAKFVEKLNIFLKDLGCKNTHFCNPHGLHHPLHKTTAYDMALIAKEAMKIPLFRQLVSAASYQCPRTNLSEERYLTQTNHLLRQGPHYYKKAIGIKTGSTSHAGKTLLAAAENNERHLIAAVLGASTTQDRYSDVIKMFDKAFNEKKVRQTLLSVGVQKMKVKIPGGKTHLRTYLKEGLVYDFFASEPQEVKGKIQWSLPKLPIQKDQVVGTALAQDKQGRILAKTFVYALDKIEPTLSYKIKDYLATHKKLVFQISISLFVAILLLFFIKKRKRQTGY